MGNGQYSEEKKWEPKMIDADKLIKWIEEQKKATYDPGNEGIALDEALTEGNQSAIQTYDEIIAYIKII